MRMINNYIAVEYDLDHNRVINGLYRPTEWVFENSDQKEGTVVYDTNRDKKETNPQIATIVISNDKSPYKVGDKVFTHYLSYDSPHAIDLNGKEYTVTTYQNIFFKMNSDGTYEMAPRTYLGEQVYSEGERTAIGIYTTPFDTVKETLRIKLTHVPEGSEYKVGDIIVSSDDFQYIIDIYGKKLIKITEEWIYGKMVDSKLIPTV
jgi:hypothetical protein